MALIELVDASQNSAKDAKRDAILTDGHYRIVRFNGKTPTLSTVLDHLHFLFVPERDETQLALGAVGRFLSAGAPVIIP